MITTTENDYIANLQKEILILKEKLNEKDQVLNLCATAKPIEKLQSLLIFIRDNVIHGNSKYVEMINSVLGGS